MAEKPTTGRRVSSGAGGITLLLMGLVGMPTLFLTGLPQKAIGEGARILESAIKGEEPAS